LGRPAAGGFAFVPAGVFLGPFGGSFFAFDFLLPLLVLALTLEVVEKA
jgi:hypothetical protein